MVFKLKNHLISFFFFPFLYSGALARAKRAQRSTVGNKIWQTIRPRKLVMT